MPSPYASFGGFYGAENAIDDASDAQYSIAGVGRAFGSARGGIFGGLAGAVGPLKALGMDIDENSRLLRALHIAIATNVALFSLYRVVTLMRRAEEQRELALAAGETAIRANPLTWWMIVLAAAGAGVVYASFHVGGALRSWEDKYSQLRSGDWKLSGGDISNPSDRRRMTTNLAAISEG
jgi:hypothetical protein